MMARKEFRTFDEIDRQAGHEIALEIADLDAFAAVELQIDVGIKQAELVLFLVDDAPVQRRNDRDFMTQSLLSLGQTARHVS